MMKSVYVCSNVYAHIHARVRVRALIFFLWIGICGARGCCVIMGSLRFTMLKLCRNIRWLGHQRNTENLFSVPGFSKLWTDGLLAFSCVWGSFSRVFFSLHEWPFSSIAQPLFPTPLPPSLYHHNLDHRFLLNYFFSGLLKVCYFHRRRGHCSLDAWAPYVLTWYLLIINNRLNFSKFFYFI